MALNATYNSGDMAPSIIDVIVTFIVQFKDFIGLLAIAIALGLLVHFVATGKVKFW